MQQHCVRGYEMVHKIPFLRDAADLVYAHHENFDGSGYPRGLKGEEIPLGARIFAVADTFDAMTSDRPYRRGLSYATARNELMRCSGTQFDPQIVQVFLHMPEEIWMGLHKEVEHAPAGTMGVKALEAA
jgi:HD-GYP domain-containing protein (c-di-GMP phosphodiesterase class II)